MTDEQRTSKDQPTLREVVESVVDWNTRHPSSRIYSEGEIRRVAKEMDEIFERAKAALAAQPELSAFERNRLRSLIDDAWNAATESEQVPSTKWADEIIDKWLAESPLNERRPDRGMSHD
jgi:hypothetical protein